MTHANLPIVYMTQRELTAMGSTGLDATAWAMLLVN